MRRAPFNRRPYTGRKSPARDATGAKAYKDLRVEVFDREGGVCVSCGEYATLDVGECHHRKLRSRGGTDDAWNCIWLCSTCHVEIHATPRESTRYGFMCPSWEDPSGWPVKIADGWFIPSPDGWLKASMRVEQEAS